MSLVTICGAPLYGTGAHACSLEPEDVLDALDALDLSLRGAAPSRAQWDAITTMIRVTMRDLIRDLGASLESDDAGIDLGNVVPFPCAG